MAQDLFQYDKMVERALRGVVRDALARVAQEGPRGAHHFYVAFATGMPGVVIPDSLRERFPEEMTIVLQHQFWDLEIGDESFSVSLSFQKQLERLTIPFAAICSFADPSVNFVLEFGEPPVAEPKTVGSLPAPKLAPEPASEDERPAAEIVTLDSFRKR
ncbi:MAG TPA: ClpXP protease specificity-enhancing factor SspB [Stellaceae bacterium]